MAFVCLMGFILVGDTLYIRRLLKQGQEIRNNVRETTLPEEGTRQTSRNFNHKILNTATFPAREMSTFVQFPSRKQLLSRVAKAIRRSKESRGTLRRNNSDIWSSFWRNEKSGKLKSETRELALYEDVAEIEKVKIEKSKQQQNTNIISITETGDEIKWRLSHLKP